MKITKSIFDKEGNDIDKFNEYDILIDQTETECNKYLRSSIKKNNT